MRLGDGLHDAVATDATRLGRIPVATSDPITDVSLGQPVCLPEVESAPVRRASKFRTSPIQMRVSGIVVQNLPEERPGSPGSFMGHRQRERARPQHPSEAGLCCAAEGAREVLP